MAGPLAAFAPLMGHCFAATLVPDVVDTHCFTDVYQGAHVRDIHVVTTKGKQSYAGETLYSFDGKVIRFTYVNSLGGVGYGSATVAGRTIDFAGSMQAAPGGAGIPIRTEWTVGERAYSVAAQGKPPTRFVRVR
jgi:hypothetical protein